MTRTQYLTRIKIEDYFNDIKLAYITPSYNIYESDSIYNYLTQSMTKIYYNL